MKIALALFAMLSGAAAQAGVTVYSGPAAEKLFVESAPKLGEKVFLVKAEGIDSKWAGKVIKTRKRSTPNGARYSFEYTLELSSGIKKRTYEIVAEDGFELVNGSRVPKVLLSYPEASNEPLVLNYDADLTKASQAVDLRAQYDKSPAPPDVD